MVTALKSRQACVQFADPTAPSDLHVSTAAFLKECRQSALARFHNHRDTRHGGRTIEHRVPPKPGDQGSTGMIVIHLSPSVCRAWEADVEGSLTEKRAHVEAQVHLALEDLADQDMHGYLALTDPQRAIFDPDLIQLMNEALDRTTFSHLGRQADPHWEGTLVERVQPPYLVLVVSVGMAGRARNILSERPAPRTRVPHARREAPAVDAGEDDE